MTIALKLLLYTTLVGTIFGGLYVATRTPYLLESITYEPDGEHNQPVYGKRVVGQRLTAPLPHWAGVSLALDPATRAADSTVIILHIREAQQPTNIRTIQTTLGESKSAVGLFFAFLPIRNSLNQAYDVVLEAPQISSREAIKLAYQIDSTKQEAGTLLVQGQVKAGDLGLTLYERPPLITLLLRWLYQPSNYGAWIALVLMGLSIVIWWQARLLPTIAITFWEKAWQEIKLRDAAPYLLLIVTSLVIVYWPATTYFFFRDDAPIILRAQEFLKSDPWRLLSAHNFIDPDNQSIFQHRFYRPITYSLYPAVLALLLEPNPAVYYFLNLVFYAISGGLLFIFSRLLLRSYSLALIATLVWGVHSAKLGILYWWSSVQDIIATIFIILTLLIYTKQRAFPDRRLWSVLLSISYTGAIFSKENAIMLLPILGMLMLWEQPLRQLKNRGLRQPLKLFVPLLFISGFYILIRTIILSDPSLPAEELTDTTHSLHVDPLTHMKNIVLYAAWSAEHWLWPNLDVTQGFDSRLVKWLGRDVLTPPLYPGLLLIISYFGFLIGTSSARPLRRLLLLAGGWWALWVLPHLFMGENWQARWLSLAVWSLGVCLAGLIHVVFKRNQIIYHGAVLLTCCILFVYGFTIARAPQITQGYKQESEAPRAAIASLQRQMHHLTSRSTVYLVDVSPEQKSSVNPFLIRLFAAPSPRHVYFLPQLPSTLNPADIVITMPTRP